MSTLEEVIASERQNANGAAQPAASGGDDAKAEARRAKDRERKARERAGKGGAKAPRAPREASAPDAEVPLDPRVTRAVVACMKSMTMDEITPEFEKEMQEALGGALAYEIEVRLPFLADEYAPEVGLGCAVVGAGVTRFRAKRKKARDAKRVANGPVIPDVPPDPTSPAAPEARTETEPSSDHEPDPFAALGLTDAPKVST